MKIIASSLLLLSLFVSCQSKEKAETSSNSPESSKSGQKTGKSGGTFYINLGAVPTTLNPISSSDAYATGIQNYVFSSLLDRDLDTNEWKPDVASEWTISKDLKTFTFKIRDGVKFHDGKPLTVEDIKYSFDVIRNGEYSTAHRKPYIENIKEVKIIDKNTVQYTASKKYFGNFTVLAGLVIVPKHIYHKVSKKQKKKLNRSIIGSGPYKLTMFDRKKGIELTKVESWHGNELDTYKGMYNFKKLFFRFVKEENIEIEMVKKGKIDYAGLTAEGYMKKTSGAEWGTKVFKQEVQNRGVKGYGFVAWNFQNEMFKDKEVRKALYMLLNRKKMIEKFNFNKSVPATGPLYQQSIYADPSVKPVPFDPKEALSIFREAGWKDSDKDGILDKMIKGKKRNFSFTLLNPSKDFTKYLTIYQEDAKQAGIEIKIKLIEWNAFIKLLDERKYEAVVLAWGGGSLDWDPKQIWHSSSSKGKGSNFISYSNPLVDKLIDQAREIVDQKERIPVLRKVYRLIAEDYPYAFLFNSQYTFYMHTKKSRRPKDTFEYGVGVNYWWIGQP